MSTTLSFEFLLDSSLAVLQQRRGRHGPWIHIRIYWIKIIHMQRLRRVAGILLEALEIEWCPPAYPFSHPGHERRNPIRPIHRKLGFPPGPRLSIIRR